MKKTISKVKKIGDDVKTVTFIIGILLTLSMIISTAASIPERVRKNEENIVILKEEKNRDRARTEYLESTLNDIKSDVNIIKKAVMESKK